MTLHTVTSKLLRAYLVVMLLPTTTHFDTQGALLLTPIPKENTVTLSNNYSVPQTDTGDQFYSKIQ